MQAVSRTPSQLGNFWKVSTAPQNVWKSLVVGVWRSAPRCYWSGSSSWFLPLKPNIFSSNMNPFKSNLFHPLSSGASIVFLPLRWKGELCSRKTSAWNRRPLPLAVTRAGPRRLSGTPASVLWVPTENDDVLMSCLHWYVCVKWVSTVVLYTWQLLPWLTLMTCLAAKYKATAVWCKMTGFFKIWSFLGKNLFRIFAVIPQRLRTTS